MFPGESPCDQYKSLAFVLVQSPQSIFWALFCDAQERCVICSMNALIFVKQWAARGDGVGPQQESDAPAAWLSGSLGLQNFGHPCSLHLQFFFPGCILQFWSLLCITCIGKFGEELPPRAGRWLAHLFSWISVQKSKKKKNPMNIVIPLLEISLRFCIFPREHRRERTTNVSLILEQHVYINWLYFRACWVVFLVLHDNGISWVVKIEPEVRIFGQMKNCVGSNKWKWAGEEVRKTGALAGCH